MTAFLVPVNLLAHFRILLVSHDLNSDGHVTTTREIALAEIGSHQTDNIPTHIYSNYIYCMYSCPVSSKLIR